MDDEEEIAAKWTPFSVAPDPEQRRIIAISYSHRGLEEIATLTFEYGDWGIERGGMAPAFCGWTHWTPFPDL